MPLTTPFDSRHALAKRLQDHAKPTFDKLTLLPHNRYADDSDLWWLVPSNRSPAFADTKFYVGKDHAGTQNFEVGIYAEKGFGNAFAHFDPPARNRGWILGDSWHWAKFLQLVKNGRLFAAMQSATQTTEAPIFLRVHAYHHTTRSELETSSDWTSVDKVVYVLNPGSAHLDLAFEPVTTQGIIKRWQAEEVDEIAGLLQSLTENEWAWLDVMLYTHFAPAKPEEATWDAYRIWNAYLRSFAFAVGSMQI